MCVAAWQNLRRMCDESATNVPWFSPTWFDSPTKPVADLAFQFVAA
jgi:hypothetical protein